jgi:hypothetical protein
MNANEILEDEVFIGSSLDDLQAEIRENLCLISMSSEERATISLEALVDFYEKLIANRAEQITNFGKHGMIFYTWHDAQASQLRFCLISDFHSKLPFGADIVPASLEEILEEFLASPDHIPFSDLSFDDSASTEPNEEFKLKVFQKHLLSS